MSNVRTAFPVLPNATTQAFIDANVGAADQTGDIQTDMKKAFIVAMGLSGNNYSLDDLWKRWTVYASGINDPPHIGQHPGHYLTEAQLNAGEGFPTAAVAGTLTGYELHPTNRITFNANEDVSAMWMSTDGSYMVTFHDNAVDTNSYHEYDLSTAFDVSTAVERVGEFDPSTFRVRGMWMSPDGTKLFGVDGGTNIKYHTLTTPYSVTTAGAGTIEDMTGVSAGVSDIQFNSGGTKMYLLAAGDNAVHEFDLSTAFDPSTRGAVVNTLDYSALTGVTMRGMAISPDGGTVILVSETVTEQAYRFTLSTPFDLSTGSDSTERLPLDAQILAVTTPWGIQFSEDATKIYVVINGGANTMYTWDNSLAVNAFGEMLIHFDGTDGQTSATDVLGSTPLTFNSLAELDTAEKKFGSASLLCNGYVDFDNTFWTTNNLENGDLTVELWYRPDGLAAANDRLIQMADGDVLAGFSIGHLNTTQIYLLLEFDPASGGWDYAGPGSPVLTAGQWYHVAYVREVDKHSFYVNGSLVGSTENTADLYINGADDSVIGGQATGRQNSGHIDEVRISARAVYNQDFTPRTSAFPDS